MKCLAAVAHKVKEPFSLETIELPEPGADEVLVKIAGVGLCHTDLSSKDGLIPSPYPVVFGHEGSGVVERVGSQVRKVAPGDHVVLSFASCGLCEHCLTGEPAYCDVWLPANVCMLPNCTRGQLGDGSPVFLKYFGQSSFGEYALATERNVVKVRKDVPIELLGPMGCGIQTGAGTVLNGLRPAAGSSLAVLGSGSVGLAAILGALVCGCTTVIAIDVMESRLEMARSLGATHTINGKGIDVAEALRRIVPRGVDCMVDTTALPELVQSASAALAIRGKLGLVGVPHPTAELKLAFIQILTSGITVQGFGEGHCVPDSFIPRLIDLYAQGRFPFDKMVTFYPFRDINRAVEDQKAGKVVKVILRHE